MLIRVPTYKCESRIAAAGLRFESRLPFKQFSSNSTLNSLLREGYCKIYSRTPRLSAPLSYCNGARQFQQPTTVRAFSASTANHKMVDEVRKAFGVDYLQEGDAKTRLLEFLNLVRKIGDRDDVKGYAIKIQKDLELVEAKEDGYVKFNYTVKDEVLNMSEMMHGGFIAVVFDIVTTMSLIVNDKQQAFNMGGVSRALDISYLRPIPRGSVVIFESELLQKGRSTTYMYATAKSKETGKLLATASHHKLNPKM